MLRTEDTSSGYGHGDNHSGHMIQPRHTTSAHPSAARTGHWTRRTRRFRSSPTPSHPVPARPNLPTTLPSLPRPTYHHHHYRHHSTATPSLLHLHSTLTPPPPSSRRAPHYELVSVPSWPSHHTCHTRHTRHKCDLLLPVGHLADVSLNHPMVSKSHARFASAEPHILDRWQFLMKDVGPKFNSRAG